MAAEMWAFRARGELEATQRYARLASRLPGTRFESLTAEVEQAAEDEAEHAELCARMAARFGTELSRSSPRPAEVGPRDLDAEQRLAWELVAVGCFSESTNAGLLLHTLDVATDSETREVVRQLLSDEVRHARIGWRALELADMGWISPFFPRILAATVHEELATPTSAGAEETAQSETEWLELGVLSLATLRAVLRSSLNDVIIPGFEAHGIDAVPLRTAAARFQA